MHDLLKRVLKTVRRTTRIYLRYDWCYNFRKSRINWKDLPVEEGQPENGGKTLLPPVSKKDSRHSPLLWLLDEGGELRKAVDVGARRKVAGSCRKSARRVVAAPLSRPTAAHKLEGDAAAELAGTGAASDVRQSQRSAELRR